MDIVTLETVVSALSLLLLGLTADASLIILGSGTPIPEPDRFGPSVAIVVNGQAYLFDAGAGVVRRAEAAAEKYHLGGLQAPSLNRLFLTHLHSDHTLGYPDVIFTSWVMGRPQALDVYGPTGTDAMTKNLKLAFADDIAIRSQGLEHLSLAGLTVNSHEIHPGLVYRDANVEVRAFPVCHGSWKEAYGYSIKAQGRTIVISGDTAPCASLAEACQKCDVLLHEVYSSVRLAALPRDVKRYHSSFHTSAIELAALANKAKPKLLVLYHQIYFGPREGVDLVKEIHEQYSGEVMDAKDLDLF